MNDIVAGWVERVDIRYPSEVATKDEARAAVKAMRTVRAFVSQKLGLSDEVK